MITTVCLVSFHELGLKGKNRTKFEYRLMTNIDFRLALDHEPVGRCERHAGRVLFVIEDPARADVIAHKVALLAGVLHTAVAYRIGRDLDEIDHVALRAYREAPAGTTFRVTTHRSNTDFPLTSLELNAHVGAFIVEQTGARVQLKGADTEVSLIVTGGSTYVSAARITGIGGLPAGSSGRIISLLSSGIDSPVATWRMLRRGALGIGLHFSGRPQTSAASEELVRRIGEVLAATGGMGRIAIVPFGDIQKDIATCVMPDMRILMYRRVMFEVAQKVALEEGARALVTGESLGQVASQTLENICAVDEVARIPVLRPLIGTDKLEIMDEARRIGTYDLSIQDAADCCTLFMPRRPETHASLEIVHRNWDLLPVEEYVSDACAQIERVDYPCRPYQNEKRPTAL